MKRLLFAAAMLLFISGCATQSVKLSDAIPVPADRIYMADTKSEDFAEVTIIRDSGFIGSGCYASIFIDGELATKMSQTEKVSFRVKEGGHILGMTLRGRGLCNFGTDLQEQEFTVKPGDKKFYRAFIDPYGVPLIMPTTQIH